MHKDTLNAGKPVGEGERQVTLRPHGHMLTNSSVWTRDGRWVVYDTRSGADGAVFDGTRIERVEVDSGRVETLYESRDGACCGVVTTSPVDDRVVFILGPTVPTAEWSYGPSHRRGVIVRASRPGVVEPLDARDIVPPFTPGALRGGSHVHVFSGDGRLVSFTYEDAVLDARGEGGTSEGNLRCVGVSVCDRPVRVPRTHSRNRDGTAASVVVTMLEDNPLPEGDAIERAYEEGWIGDNGYRRSDGTWQRYALAFQGLVRVHGGGVIAEVFIVDLPEDPSSLFQAGERPLCGTPTTRPAPPSTVAQRRLTRTGHRLHPGIQGPRHWLRSSPDGSRIAFLARDDVGIVQIFTVSPRGGEPVQMTHGPIGIESSFTWSPDGSCIACVIGDRVTAVDCETGEGRPLTRLRTDAPPRPEACVFSPDGRRIAFMRRLPSEHGWHNQICVVEVDRPTV